MGREIETIDMQGKDEDILLVYKHVKEHSTTCFCVSCDSAKSNLSDTVFPSYSALHVDGSLKYLQLNG